MSVKDSDTHKLMYHPAYVEKWLNNELVPLNAEIGITNRCNHRCKFCGLDWLTHGVDNIDKDVMIRCLKDMADMGVKVTYYAGEGEPTLHKDFAEFITYGKSLGMSQSVSTNGSLFNKELANKILYLINNKKVRENMSKAARKFSKKFSWDDAARKYLKITKEVTE